MLKRLLNHRTAGITSAAFILGVSNLVSRLLGLVRDRLLAGRFGASIDLDIYYAAFRIPDLIYNIVVVGAISAAFIPIFAEYFERDKQKAWRYTANVLNVTLLFLVGLSVLFILAAPVLVPFVAPGFTDASFAATVALTRIMFLSPILLGLSAIVSGVLHYFSRFFVYSLAPICYNLGIIFGIVFLVPPMGLVGLAWGVALGALLHFIVQVPALVASGFSWKPLFDFKEKGLWETIRLMVPRVASLASQQVNLWVVTAMASLAGTGAIAIFNLSNNLQYLPVGIIGIAFATAAFPNLAAASARKSEEFVKQLFSTFKMVFFLTFPLSLVFFMLRAHIVRVVLGTGEFGWEATRLTAAAVGIFGFAVFAQALIPLLARAFFAMKNTVTPTVLSIVYVVLNVVLALFFLDVFRSVPVSDNIVARFLKVGDLGNVAVLALPLALSIASLVYFALLLFYLHRALKGFNGARIGAAVTKTVVATLLSLPVGYVLLYGLAEFLPTETGPGIFMQGFFAGAVTIFLFAFFAIVFKSEEVLELKKGLQKRLLRPKTLPKTIQEENGKF